MAAAAFELIKLMAAQPLPKALPGSSEVWSRLESLVDWERVQRARMRVDLGPELDLMHRLGDPHRAVKTIHVTGSKGKGSVCALVEAALRQAGCRTGLYASPHVVHVTERVNLQGQPVTEALMADALQRSLDARDAACLEGTPAASASWFDVVTAAAFCVFEQARVDWAVVEVGLGGRLDSTNVVDPELAIITNIGLEHTDVLGPTLTHIATEKAGIIKPGRPVLTTEPLEGEAGRVIATRAQQCASPWIWVDTQGCVGFTASNLKLARAAMDELGRQGHTSPQRWLPLSALDLPDDLAASVALPGRAEWLRVPLHLSQTTQEPAGSLQVVLDAAHVDFAMTALLDELARKPALQSPPVVVLALASDKNAQAIVQRLTGRVQAVVCTELAAPSRCWPAAQLQALCEAQGLTSHTEVTPLNALEWALEWALKRPLDRARDHDASWVLVTGSFYLVKELRPILLERGARHVLTSGLGRSSS